MKENLTFILGHIAGSINPEDKYTHVQESLDKLAHLDDKRGAIKYAFCKNGIYCTSEVIFMIKQLMNKRNGHEILMYLNRELINAKNYQGTWLQLVNVRLSDGSKIFGLNSVTAKTLLNVLNTANKIYLNCKRHDLNNHLFKIQYNFAKGSLERKGVNNITFAKVVNELIKEDQEAKTAKVPF